MTETKKPVMISLNSGDPRLIRPWTKEEEESLDRVLRQIFDEEQKLEQKDK